MTSPRRRATDAAAAVIGCGVVGSRVVRHLAAALPNCTVFVHDVRAANAERTRRTSGPNVVVAALDTALAAPIVVIAAPNPQAELALRVAQSGRHVVTTTDDVGDVTTLLAAASVSERGATVVVGANMAPGLAGLFARHLASGLDTADEIHVAVHGTGGPDCARQHHHALGGRALGWHDREWTERPAGSGRELCWFPDPVGPRDCYRAEMPDPLALHAAFPGVIRISARMSATRRDRLTARLPMLSPPHREGAIGALRVEVRGARGGGRETEVIGVAMRAGAAAAVTASVVALALHDGTIERRGTVVLGDAALPNRLLLERIRTAGVTVSEFVGSGSTASSW